MANEFNYEIDKITEREVVYDFFSRLSLGKDMTYDDLFQDPNLKVLFNAGDNVKEIISKLASVLPGSITNNIRKIKVGCVEKILPEEITEDKIEEYKRVDISLPAGSTLLLVYSEKTNLDLSSLFEQGGTNNNKDNYTMRFDVLPENDDIYKVYYLLPEE